MVTVIWETVTGPRASAAFVPPSAVVIAPAGMVFEFGLVVYACAGAEASVVISTVIVQVLLAGMVPFVKVTVRVGEPESATVAVGKKVSQVVVGGPVNRRLLFGVVGRVSARLALV